VEEGINFLVKCILETESQGTEETKGDPNAIDIRGESKKSDCPC
jgi:hypothetical protein